MSEPQPTKDAAIAIGDTRSDREQVLAREKEQFGGMKFGTAFFGWLTATGTALILTAILTGVGAAIGLQATTKQARDSAAQNADTVGLVGAIVLLATLFIAYLCGGYVAGWMARFNGAKQGIAVWLWAIIIAIVLAIVGVIAGTKFDVLSQLNSLPQIPINAETLTAGTIITAIAVVIVTLLGAILGGLAGMRYHRRVDRAGLGR